MELQHFKSTILPIKDRLYRIAFNMVRSVEEAEDILQDAMVKLWNNRENWSEYRNMEAYAITVTKNLCLDKLKSKKVRGDYDVQQMQLDSGVSSPYQKLEISDSVNAMKAVLLGLPDQQRLLITLRDVEGYSYDEIAEQTGMDINNIRVGISRARKRAKEEYLKIMSYGN
jgi:RNA polymerase sigma-70 factor (ECF subfamily)